jgi:FMN reductase
MTVVSLSSRITLPNSLPSPKRALGIAGNLKRPSRTRALVEAVLKQISAEGMAETELLDLVDAAPELFVETATDEVVSRPGRVVKAIGLFKHLFDLVDPKALHCKPVILTATGGSDRHALVIESHLRPLFGFFGALTLPASIYVSDRDFEPDAPLPDTIASRVVTAVTQLQRWTK